MRARCLRIIRQLGIVGECNVQFALNPTSKEIFVIEVNARLSRSSALASKATGYPLAFVAAKLALGHPLPIVANNITKATTAFFEPSLDYVVVKIPRWDLVKFSRVSRKLGSAMKSVGEIMAVGRTFEEAIQKGLRMVNSSVQGFEPSPEELAREEFRDPAKLEAELKGATDRQIFAIAQAMLQGMSVDHIHNLSKVDKWFLSKLQRITDIRNEIAARKDLALVDKYVMRDAKQAGFSDKQIARVLLNSNEASVRAHRKQFGIVPAIKRIDTLAGEWVSKTNYLYMTYNGTTNDVLPEKPHMIVVGSGCYRIGSSVEFDWCGVETVRQLRKRGVPTVMINNNPETVSTDHTSCDRLYFEEISYERVLDIYEAENPLGIVLGVGGQLPNNLALPLQGAGCKLMGTSATDVDRAEDRSKFSSIIDQIGLHQPAWNELTSVEEGIAFAEKVGYPVVVRPSYVLSGAAMRVATSSGDLVAFLRSAAEISPDHPVVVSKFIEDAMEIDFDGIITKDRQLGAFAVSEHIERAGVHSGDATHVLPAPHISDAVYERVLEAATRIGLALNICGLFNIQFMLKDDHLMVIECNIRASRSLPFVTKTLGVDIIGMAAQAMMGETVKPVDCRPSTLKLAHTCVKAPMFSFKRLAGADPVLGVEMASTGEVGCFGFDHLDALAKSLQATNIPIPRVGANIVVIGEDAKQTREFEPSAQQLVALGYAVHTASSDTFSDVDALIRNRKVALVLSFGSRHAADKGDNEFTALRRVATDFATPTILDVQVAKWLVEALVAGRQNTLKYTTTLQEYNSL
jgi:carbamoyl-phosphate synthase large subunit